MRTALFNEINNFTPKRNKSHASKYDKGKSKTLVDTKASFFQWHYVFFLFFILVIYFLFIGRAISIQISDQDKYLGLADRNRIREFSILPSRGVIYDRNGNVIARNKPSFSIEINTLICGQGRNLSYCKEIVESVDKYVSLEDKERIYEELEVGKTNIILATGVEKEEILVLEANISDLVGVSIETAPTRDYLYGPAFSHLVGYVGLGEEEGAPVIVGKTGIEEAYDSNLSGTAGAKIVQVDSLGTSYRLITSKEPLPGKDITLNVDIGLQGRAYLLLEKEINDPKKEATGGAVVAQNPLDGSVLALVSYPSFNPNLMSSGISNQQLAYLSQNPNKPFFNRAIAASYPPGSTFKLITASAILMEGIAGVYDTIIDEGFIQIGPYIYRNWNTGGEGETNLIRALQRSNDTYFYIMGGGYGGIGGLGIEKLHKWALEFGFNKLTGIDIGGEVIGFIPNGTHRDWYQGDDFISSIGQGDLLTTPIQINNMMTYFANGGYLFEPKVVRSVDGMKQERPRILAQDLLDESSYDAIRKGINAVTKPGGTAYPVFGIASKYGIQLAGKTGTAEFISPEGEEKTHAIFTVFGPYFDDEQRQASMSFNTDTPIVLTVFLEGGGGGSQDAAPIANELLEYWFAR
ncbi:penicillin-binding protein 2 [Patescibacteria group bacterium]